MAKIIMNNELNTDLWVSFPIEVYSSQEAEWYLKIDTTAGLIDIDWGDGTIETNQPVNTYINHTYSADIITILKFRPVLGLPDVIGISFDNYNGKITCNNTILNPLINLETYSILSYDAVFTGNISSLNPSLKTLSLKNSSLTGVVSDFPDGLENLELSKNSTQISGLITELPSNLKVFRVSLNSKFDLNGDIQDLPNSLLDFFYNTDYGILTGNIINLPNSLTSFKIWRCQAANLTGNVSNFGNNLLNFDLQTTNSIAGNIANIPITLNIFRIQGINTTITGDLKDLPLRYFVCSSPNIVYTNGLIIPTTESLYLELLPVSTSNLDSINLDQLLIDLDNQTFNKTNSTITINNLNTPTRTAASNTAVTNLIAAGVNLNLK